MPGLAQGFMYRKPGIVQQTATCYRTGCSAQILTEMEFYINYKQ